MYRADVKGLAVDVGAGVGNHSLWLAAVCGLYVAAFEPLDWRRFEANVDLNPMLPIRLHPYALGDCKRDGDVEPAPEHVTGRALNSYDSVPIRTLDSHNLSNVSLIKIDVEGMEAEVLRGAADTINHFHPILYIEAIDIESSRLNAAEIPKGYVHTQTFGATPLEVWEWQP